MRQMMPGCCHTSSTFFTLTGIALLGAVPATALTLPVTNTNDNGPGSLRQAILTANGTPASDTITFAIGTGLRTITPQSALPTITSPLIIDGATQPGFAGKPLIVLHGTQSGGPGSGINGFTIQAANCQIKSLVIGGFNGNGIFIDRATGNSITGCYIGTNAAGTAALPNASNGITIFNASNNVIGGLTASERNVLSGNANGVNINGFDIGADNNKVQGNYIGTNAGGTAALPNNNAGIFVEAGAKNNLIGGPTSTARNIISGNGGNGIVVFDAGTDNNKVQGNYIGTNAAGSAALPNNAVGISVLLRSGSSGPKNTLIGGIASAPGSAPGNVISSNQGHEVTIEGAGTNNTLVQGNLIGTNASGTAALKAAGGTSTGVRISNGVQVTIVGGTATGARNVISGNDGGVIIEGTGPTDNLTVSNVVQGNYIGTNITGSAAIGNRIGVLVIASKNNSIGGASTTLGQTPGNIISGNHDFHVRILGVGASSNKVQGNLIGTNKDGNAVLGSADTGVRIDSGAKSNLIGGVAANQRNVISGSNNGVVIVDAGTESNILQGNLIGTNVSGSGALPNRDAGVTILEGASRNTVNNNVISGNAVGIALHSGATANRIGGNKIGTDIMGLRAVPNSSVGVLLTSASEGNIIGGTTSGARNIISGNGIGVSINNDGTKANLVQGNYIGVNANGAALGNRIAGIEITSGAFGNLIGAPANADDAATRAGANRIAFNGNSGVRVSEETTFNNTIRGNSIFGNGGLGINLEPARENPDPNTAHAPTPNDRGDADSGPNHLQNFPVLTALSNASGATTISGTLNSRPSVTFVIDFYRNTQGDTSGFGEGEFYLGAQRVTTDTSGNASFTFSAPGTFSGTTISATATNLTTGETSEFSPLSLSNVVTNTNNDGLGSLRTALRVAGVVDNTTIRFNIPATLAVGGVFTIKPLTPLPTITRNGTILDGTTQTAFTGNTNSAGPEIVINGGSIPAGFFDAGLTINGDNCVVRGLVINGFPNAISIAGNTSNLVASSNKIEGCYIGTSPAGMASVALANIDDGIRLGGDGFTPGTGAANNIVGGTTAATRNVISNNGRYGIVMSETATSGNLVQGNYIGTNPAGTVAVPNARGIVLFGGAHDNVIGGTTAAMRNLLFGNGDVGIVILSDAGTNRNKVQGNYIGINAAGTAALVTGTNVPDIFGVRITDGAQANIIGGTVSGAGNVIAGLTNGIGLRGVGTNGNLVQGNFIGLNAAGTAAIPNAGNGIIISSGAQNNVIGAARDATGTAVSAAGNRIGFSSGSDGDGVRIFATPTEQTIGNTVRGNRIFSSTFLGINLFPSTEAVGTATPNDAGDGDSGPNRLQNFPVISSVTTSGTNVIVSGTLNSTPGRAFVIDLYRNTGNNSSCAGGEIAEGELYVASQNVTTGTNGTIAFSFTVSSAGGQVITVTATNLTTGDTSEFSPTSLGSAASAVTNTRDSGPGSLRAALASAGVCSNTVTFNIPQTDVGFNAATGTFTIQLATPLPNLATNGIIIDGTSQPGFSGHPLIVLSGANAGATGIGITAANCVVKGLVISGFKGRQISITGASALNNVVQGCYIGTNAAGTAGIAGGGAGIVISNGARNNKIGGILANEANRIAFNGGDGVVVGSSASDTATGNAIRGNRIYGNSGIGINLVGGAQDSRGVTSNDAGDADTGPNNLQNFPLINGLRLTGTSSVSGTVEVSLNSRPSTNFALDFYRVTTPDSSRFGEGEFYLGSRTVTTDATGNYKGTLSFNLGGNFNEQSLCATATNLTTGDTSEFGPGQMLTGTVYTWGYNNLGQLGDNSTTNKLLPQAINLNGIATLAAGGAHSLAVKSDGTVWSWGNNGSGQLGDGTGANRLTPVQVPGLFDVQAVAAGWYHSLALKRDGSVWAWGSNNFGQLGDGTNLVSALPVQVRNLSGVIAITAGVYYSVALKSDGTVWCWGSNFYGQLGDGTKINRNTLVQVKNVSGIIAIAAGAGHTVLLKSDGIVITFGWNSTGQLGNGTTTDSQTPITVSGVRASHIAAGYGHTLAVESSGAGVFAWGSNASGQLGDGSNANRLSPVRVSNFSGVRLIAAGSSHSLAVKSDGTLWSWGNNIYGAVGDGSLTDKNIPVQTPGLDNVNVIGGGFSHSMALAIRAATTSARTVVRPAPFEWSGVTATVSPASVLLSSALALDATIAGDANCYSLFVNGLAVAVQSASYNATNDTVTLKLPLGTLQNGDEVTVVWQGLRDKQNQLLGDGQQTIILH